MGRIFKTYYGGGSIWVCVTCQSHFSLTDDLVSKAFQGRHGRAYLFANVMNVTMGHKDDRLLTTGLHTVSDIFCAACGTNVGWYYHAAFEPREKYKEGKFILEKEKMKKVSLGSNDDDEYTVGGDDGDGNAHYGDDSGENAGGGMVSED